MPSRVTKFLLATALVPSPAFAAPLPLTPSPPSAEDAPIALLVDMSSGQTLFAREEDRRFMPASITKVMTTYLAFERLKQGKLFRQQSLKQGLHRRDIELLPFPGVVRGVQRILIEMAMIDDQIG